MPQAFQFDTPAKTQFKRAFAASGTICFATGAFCIAAVSAAPAAALPLARPLAAAELPMVRKIAVFGSDDRQRLPPPMANLSGSIGLFQHSRSGTTCTAFCLADDIVATASHCIYRTQGETALAPEAFVFSRPGTALPPVRVVGGPGSRARLNIISGATGIKLTPPIGAAHDWALVRLERSACRGHTLRINISEMTTRSGGDIGTPIFNVAFHEDFKGSGAGTGSATAQNLPTLKQTAERRTTSSQRFNAIAKRSSRAIAPRRPLAYTAECSLTPTVRRDLADPAVTRGFAASWRLIFHRCDTGGASSGSPLLINTPRGPEVIGINVGTFVATRLRRVNNAGIGTTIDTDSQTAAPLPEAVANTAVSVTAFSAALTRMIGRQSRNGVARQKR